MNSERRIANDLYDLSEALIKQGHETTGGFLGGEFGYGAFFENDVFMMHPFCWCEQDDCPWCWGCECPERAHRYFVADAEVTCDEFFDGGGYRQPGARSEPVAELTCAYCKGSKPNEPNFRHKPTGTEVSWYKYIGRSMEIELTWSWFDIFAECMASIGLLPDPSSTDPTDTSEGSE